MLQATRMKLPFSTCPLFNVCQNTWTCAHTHTPQAHTHTCLHPAGLMQPIGMQKTKVSDIVKQGHDQGSYWEDRNSLDYLLHFIRVAMKPLKSILIFKQYGAQLNKPNRSGVQSRCSSLGLRNVIPLCFEGNKAD